MSIKAWIRKNAGNRLFIDPRGERFITQDFNVPPAPEALIRLGLAATLEEAQALIDKDKTYWGGGRSHSALDRVEAWFGPHFPVSVAFGAKPAVYEKFVTANRQVQTVIDPETQQPIQAEVDLGFGPVFEEWKARDLIV